LKSPAAGTSSFSIAWLWILPAVALGAATALDPEFRNNCFLYLPYYLIALLVFAWAATAIALLREESPGMDFWRRDRGLALVGCLLFAALIFLSVPPYYRVLSDETNMLSVSRSMVLHHSTHNVIQAKWTYFNERSFEFIYEKRPFLFPWLVSLAHLVFGYRFWNPFLVNGIALGGVFFLVYSRVRRDWGAVSAAACVLLIAAQPVVTQTAASAGIDMLYVLFLIVSLLSLEAFLEKPGTLRFAMLWANLLMLANTRYEAPLYVVLILGGLALMRKIRREYFRNAFIYAVTPLVMLPTIWQRIEMRMRLEIPEGEKAFALDHFWSHNAAFLKSLLHFDNALPYAGVIHLAGLAAALYFSVQWLRRRWPVDPARRSWFLLTAVVCLAYWVVVNAHYSLFLTDPSGCRVMTWSAVVFSVLAFLLLMNLSGGRLKGFPVMLAALLLFVFYHPISIRNYFSNGLVLTREYRQVISFLNSRPRRDTLVISNVPGHYTVLERGGVKFLFANEQKENLLHQIRENLFQEVIAVQEIDAISGLPTEDTRLDPDYHLETLDELDHKMGQFIRISRVVPS